jgi:hypothetical protein
MAEELRQACDLSLHNAARFGTVVGVEAGSQLMAWFRTNRGMVAWLAFFALACQFALSFGHVHIGKSGAGLAAQVAVQAADPAADAPSTPQKNPIGLAGDFCAVCANISLAGALILPILALILAPDLLSRASGWPLAAHDPASFGRWPFSARGPPHA